MIPVSLTPAQIRIILYWAEEFHNNVDHKESEEVKQLRYRFIDLVKQVRGL